MTATIPGAIGPAVRIAVTSNLRLVGEAVAAALQDSGLEVTRVAWPRPGETVPPADAAAGTGQRTVTVVVCEPVDDRTVESVRAVFDSSVGATLAVAGPRPGPWWGALIEAGADAVLPSAAPLRDLVETVRSLAAGEAVIGAVERQSLLRQWFAARSDRQALRTRLATLTPREREVLEHLHRGDSAAVIAAELGVSEATVRSQIRGVLRKLQVRSQLAAVAVLDDVMSEGGPGSSGSANVRG
jgi:DNA-binding CsgD family transcriptional regulator